MGRWVPDRRKVAHFKNVRLPQLIQDNIMGCIVERSLGHNAPAVLVG
jgi:hypothetical protein